MKPLVSVLCIWSISVASCCAADFDYFRLNRGLFTLLIPKTWYPLFRAEGDNGCSGLELRWDPSDQSLEFGGGVVYTYKKDKPREEIILALSGTKPDHYLYCATFTKLTERDAILVGIFPAHKDTRGSLSIFRYLDIGDKYAYIHFYIPLEFVQEGIRHVNKIFQKIRIRGESLSPILIEWENEQPLIR